MAKSQIHSLLIERIKKLGNQGMRKMCRIDAHLGNLLISSFTGTREMREIEWDLASLEENI